MVSHRCRATRSALALWLFVLVADTAAAGSLTMLAYVLAGIVVVAFIVAEVSTVTRRDQLKPQPVRIRVADRRHRRR